MANIFPFSTTKTIVEDSAVLWTNQIVTQTPLSFSNNDISLSGSLNESYVTTQDNETHYLSVLESTHDETLEDIHNLTLSNEKHVDQEAMGLNNEAQPEKNFTLTDSGEQVVIFNIEGSDEIYGIQVAHDEDGNVHRYQFQFRKTNDGQLEAMPETVQLLSNEEEAEPTTESQEQSGELLENPENQLIETPVYLQDGIVQPEDDTDLLMPEGEEETEEHLEAVGNVYEQQESVSSDPNNDNPIMVFIKGEHTTMEEDQGQEQNLEGEILGEESFDEDYDQEESEDIKPGIENINIKQELLLEQKHNYEHHTEENEDLEPHEETPLHDLNEEGVSEAESYSTTEVADENEETIISYQAFDAQNMADFEENETLDNQVNDEHFEQLFVEENNLTEIHYDGDIQQDEESGNVLIVEKDPDGQDSDTQDYEIVEGLPVTAEGEISEDTTSTTYQESEIIYTESDHLNHTLSKKENPLQTTNILKQPKNVNKIVETKKKTIFCYMLPKNDQKENLNSLSNPWSILKSNQPTNKVQNDEQLKKIQREKLLERRYARSKEAIQAKMFNNFINKTTIPHAPVRQIRLPRKQEIKPVDTRRDEEIIVQEVMVSSKGFVENTGERLKNADKLEVTSIVELSDSDEDYNPKNGTKKKKKHKKTKPANGPISDDSDASVIEILQSDEEPDNSDNLKKERGRSKKEADDNLKRTRGRPSKSGDESSPQKKSRTEESSEVETDAERKEISCPHCPKTFPNQNSLSTHIQHHNLENSLRGTKKIPATEYKHKCENCQEAFKNSILLKRHVCKTNGSNHKCGVCSKIFKDVVTLNVHKKTHVKQNLIRSTSTVTVSPKKFLPRPSVGTFKPPARVAPSYKCKDCSKVCSTQNQLSLHEKTHKKFVCASCNASFASKLLLDTHVRIKCVKTASPKDKRLSFKIRRSYVHSPRRKSVNPVIKKPSTTSMTDNANHLSRNPKCANSGAVSKNLKPALNSSIVPRNVNPGLNTSNMIRTLDVEAKCDSCPMKFSNLTNLFKHKVKAHGLSTPDKRVLEPEKKSLRMPLKDHGGIPTHDRMNKAFQEIRKKLILEGDALDTTK